MRTYTLPDGTQLTGGAFTIGQGADAVNYPPNWLQLAKQADLTRVGITYADTADPTASPASISLPTFQARCELEGVWDTFVTYMFGAAARRNQFLKLLANPTAFKVTDTNLKAAMLAAGITQDQQDRILG